MAVKRVRVHANQNCVPVPNSKGGPIFLAIGPPRRAPTELSILCIFELLITQDGPGAVWVTVTHQTL